MNTPMPQSDVASRRNSRRMSRKLSTTNWTFNPSDARRYSLADKSLLKREDVDDNQPWPDNGVQNRRLSRSLVHTKSSKKIDFRRFSMDTTPEDSSGKTRKTKRGSVIRPTDISDISISEEVIHENGEEYSGENSTVLKQNSLEDYFDSNGSVLHSASTHSQNDSEMTLGEVSLKLISSIKIASFDFFL